LFLLPYSCTIRVWQEFAIHLRLKRRSENSEKPVRPMPKYGSNSLSLKARFRFGSEKNIKESLTERLSLNIWKGSVCFLQRPYEIGE